MRVKICSRDIGKAVASSNKNLLEVLSEQLESIENLVRKKLSGRLKFKFKVY